MLILAGKLTTLAKLPHYKLKFRLCRIIAMVKLRMFQAAYSEYVDIGRYDDAKNLYETYPDFYPGRNGSMVPFSLRYLYSEILFFLGKDPNLESSFSLLNFVSARFKALLGTGAPKEADCGSSTTVPPQPAAPLEDSGIGMSADPLSTVDKIIGTGFLDTDEGMIALFVYYLPSIRRLTKFLQTRLTSGASGRIELSSRSQPS